MRDLSNTATNRSSFWPGPHTSIACMLETHRMPMQGIVRTIRPRLRTNVLNHLGDAILHANVFPPKGTGSGEFIHLRSVGTNAVFGRVRESGGSTSAEHGVGRLPVEPVDERLLAERLDAMPATKRALDPEGILNPHAVIDVGGTKA